MSRKPTRDEDKQLWVEARLVIGRTPAITLARRARLEMAYERLTLHLAPANLRPFGQRLNERALALTRR